MRASYFKRRVPSLRTDSLERLAEASEGFSYTQLREAYIIAGQRAWWVVARAFSLKCTGTPVPSERHRVHSASPGSTTP